MIDTLDTMIALLVIRGAIFIFCFRVCGKSRMECPRCVAIGCEEYLTIQDMATAAFHQGKAAVFDYSAVASLFLM